MIALKLAYALALPWAAGYLLVSAVMGRRLNLAEKAAFGLGAGFGSLAFVVFILGLVGVSLTLGSISMATAASATVFFAAGRIINKGDASPAPASAGSGRAGLAARAAAAVMCAWLAFKAFFVVFEGLLRPMTAHDTWLHWAAGARLFHQGKGFLLDPSGEFFFGSAYRLFMGHPLLTTLSELWLASAIGQWDDALVKAWQPLYFLSLLAVFYTALKGKTGRLGALAAAFFLASAPLLTFHAVEGYADLTLSFYVLSGSALLLRHMETGCGRSLALSGMLYAMGAFTKNEGALVLAFASGALVLFNAIERKYKWTSVLYFAVPAALYISPWLAFKSYHGLGFGHGHSTAAVNWDNALHLEVFPVYIREVLLSMNHGLLLPFFFVMAAIGWRTIIKAPVKYLYLIVLLTMAAFLAAYAGTRDYAAVTQGTGMHRNILTFLPLAFFSACLTAARLLRRG